MILLFKEAFLPPFLHEQERRHFVFVALLKYKEIMYMLFPNEKEYIYFAVAYVLVMLDEAVTIGIRPSATSLFFGLIIISLWGILLCYMRSMRQKPKALLSEDVGLWYRMVLLSTLAGLCCTLARAAGAAIAWQSTLSATETCAMVFAMVIQLQTFL